MVIQCPKCKKQYNVDGAKITEQGVKITCPGCKHQFIARRKDEKKQKPPSRKQPKTPPCEICGAPSTHVLRGPPPKPLCEHHFGLEQEKESRFFEEDPGFAAKGTAQAIGQEKADDDNAATSLGSPPPEAVQQPKAPPPSEPAFESFDDDFDFFDNEAPAAKKASPKSDDPKKKEVEFNFDDMPSAPPAQPAPPTQPEAPAQPAPPSPPPEDPGPIVIEGDPFKPAASGLTKPAIDDDAFLPEDPGRAPSPATPDPFSPDGTGGPPASEPPVPPSAGMGDDIGQGDAFLDGTPVDDGPPPDDDGGSGEVAWADFAWEDPFKKGGGDVDSAAPEPAKPPPKPAPPPIEKPRISLKPARKVKPTSTSATISVMAALLIALLASGFLAIAGVPEFGSGADSGPGVISIPEWRGQIEVDISVGEPAIPVSEVPRLILKEGLAGAEDYFKNAQKYMFRDTVQDYDDALEKIDDALALDSNKMQYHSIKISILAFGDSFGEDGSAAARAGEALKKIEGSSAVDADSPFLVRARAHLLLLGKDYATARTMLESLDNKMDNDVITTYLWGVYYLGAAPQDKASATQRFKQAIKINPDFIRARWDLAAIYRDGNQLDQAISEYEMILEESPDRPEIRKVYALAKLERGDDDLVEPDDSERPIVRKKPKDITETGSETATIILNAIKVVEPKVRKMRLNSGGHSYRPPEER